MLSVDCECANQPESPEFFAWLMDQLREVLREAAIEVLRVEISRLVHKGWQWGLAAVAGAAPLGALMDDPRSRVMLMLLAGAAGYALGRASVQEIPICAGAISPSGAWRLAFAQ